VYEGKRVLLLYDPEFDDNGDRTLASLGVTQGKFLTIVDEDGELVMFAVAITSLPSSSNSTDKSQASAKAFT